MRRYSFLFCFPMALLLVFPIANKAGATGRGRVSAYMLNVRSVPSYEGSIEMVLHRGTAFDVIEDNGDWLRISHGNRTGYVRNMDSYVKVDATKALTGSGFVSEIFLSEGGQQIIPALGASNVTVGNTSILTVKVINRAEVLVTGKKTGFTDIVFWGHGRRLKTVRVQVGMPLSSMAENIKKMLSDIENISVIVTGNKILIDGKLLIKQDMERVQRVVAAYGSENIVNLTELRDNCYDTSLSNLVRESVGLNTVSVDVMGDSAFIKGVVYNKEQKKHIVDILKTQVKKVVDLTRVQDVMIETDVMFVELSSSDAYQMGQNILNMGGGEAATFNVELTRTRKNGEMGHLDMNAVATVDVFKFVQAAFEEGIASTLQRPHISTRNGEKGHFQSGGEMYFKVAGGDAADLESVEYGMILDITPRYKGRKNISGKMKLEVSIPVNKAGSEDLNLDKFVTENTISCNIGQSIIVSGIIENIRNHFKDKTPLLGDIPVLNFFFGRKIKDDSDKELIAIITPRVMNLPEMEMPVNSEIHSEKIKTIDPKAKW